MENSTIYKQENDLILENFDISKQNACLMSHLGKNVMDSLENTLQILREHWERMKNILKFYGQKELYRAGIPVQVHLP